MSSQAVVRRRLESAASLGNVVKTMKSLASVRVHQYRGTMRALDASTLTLDRAARALLILHPELADVAPVAPEVSITVVFGSERGLCGPFNERMARFAASALAVELDGTGNDTAYAYGAEGSANRGPSGDKVLAVGRRVTRRLRTAGLEPAAGVASPSSMGAVDVAVSTLLDLIEELRQGAREIRLRLAYARPLGATRYEPRLVQVLPVDQAWMRGLRAKPWETRKLPMELSDSGALLRGLIRHRMALAFVKAFGSSLAAENAARLMAMEAASRNIEERLESLRAQHNAARQAAVTNELLDIQAATDALG